MGLGAAGTAAAIGAVGSLGAAAIQSGNVKGAQKQSAFNQLLTTQQAQQTFNQTTGQIQDAVKQGQGYVAPYYDAGTPAIGQQNALLGLQGQDAANAAMATFQNSPSYQFQLGQGLRAIDAGAAAGVRQPGVRSGATIKAEEAYGQNLANQSFGDYYNRLYNLGQMGQTAATSEANLGTWGAGQLANAGTNLNSQISGQTTANTASAVGAANAQNSIFGNAAQGLTNTANKLLADPGVQSSINSLFNNQAFGNNTNFLNSSTVGSPTTASIYGIQAPGYA
jgi:hypothetical protein